MIGMKVGEEDNMMVYFFYHYDHKLSTLYLQLLSVSHDTPY